MKMKKNQYIKLSEKSDAQIEFQTTYKFLNPLMLFVSFVIIFEVFDDASFGTSIDDFESNAQFIGYNSKTLEFI